MDDSAAFAANWRTVLVVDAAFGLIVSIAGVVVALALTLAGGVVLVVAGAAYTALVAARARRWLRLRRDAGR